MPIITVKMAEGRTVEQKKNLIEKLTDTVFEVLATPRERITVIIEDMPKINYGVAGKRILLPQEEQ